MMIKACFKRHMMSRGAAVILAGCLALIGLAGCGAKDGGTGEENNPVVYMAGTDSQGVADATATKGRFTETVFGPDEYSAQGGVLQLLRREDDLYVVNSMGLDAVASRSTAEISAVDPEEYPSVLRERLENGDYFTEMVAAPNGARMYCLFSMAGNDYRYEKFFLSADGVETAWDTVSSDSSVGIWYGGDGYFYLTDSARKQSTQMYRVNCESGETEYLFEVDGKVNYLSVCGSRLLMDTWEELQIYDLATGEKAAEDETLTELLAESLGKNNGNYGYDFLICPGEGDSIYVVTEEGLYRHVLYGSVTEQLIDGSLCSLSDISKLFKGMCVEETEGMPIFYLLYDSGKLMRFSYDPDMPSVPETTITVYSLCEDESIRRVITAWQTANPECFIHYEVGMDGDDGVTREDALKNLATRLAAKEGPDVLILDDLPYTSYAEKGVLADLSDLYAGMQTEHKFFDNVISGMRKDGKLYAIPMLFSVPVLTGDADVLQGIESGEDMLEAFRNTTAPAGVSKAGMMQPGAVLQSMSYGYGNRFLKEDGSLDREALTEFLTLCKEIYETDTENFSPEELEYRLGMQNFYEDLAADFRSRQMYRMSRTATAMVTSTLFFGEKFSIGVLGGDVSTSFNYFNGLLDACGQDYMLLPAEGRVCLPHTMLGVNAASPVAESARQFVRYALSEYLPEADYLTGIPINRDALLKQEVNPNVDEQGNPDYEPYMSYAMSGANSDGTMGEIISVSVGWGRPEDFERYNDLLDSLDTVNYCDHVVIDTVLEEGAKALSGECSVEEAVNAIAGKVEIYLAE
ncbi:MAG: extracellular solute-binding protein [Clostridium sp.]|nr:extracellular solute-binding protein [Acetatifactor muris]MCM1527658.1 extracellular solute-binding protein [Bacteroides sp.]MCM1563398.1 extracellular solute-binding protein [Clostridium sp.]